MATKMNMPQLGYDMSQGTVIRWLKEESSSVKVGEPIVEIETDKAVVEVEAEQNGILRKILVFEGVSVPVGDPIAIIGTEEEDITEFDTLQTKDVSEIKVDDEVIEIKDSEIPDNNDVSGTDSSLLLEDNNLKEDLVVRASPVARRIAKEKGIDLTKVKGTGPSGRIVKEDILNFSNIESSDIIESSFVKDNNDKNIPLSKMRQQIARVTSISKNEKPHFYVSCEINMTKAIEFRLQLNKSLESQGIKVSINDLIVKASVQALLEFPNFNAYLDGDNIKINQQINIGIAIAEDQGLTVPAIMDCGEKSLADISIASKDLIARVKNGTLNSSEYTGGTFAISNLGMFDVSSFIAIIQPPQTAVIAVGTVMNKPIVVEDKIVIAQMMNATLSADHRIVDGAKAAIFLKYFNFFIKNPISMLV